MEVHLAEKYDAQGFRDKVEAVNKYLLDLGEDAISRDKSGAYASTGYAWQYIVDGVNLVFDGWRYDVLNLDVKEKGKSFYAEARLHLDIVFNGDLVTRGSTVGSSSNINQGDAQKGAITDALKKAFSLFSIGNLAMRGELDNDKPPPKGKPPTSAPKSKPKPEPEWTPPKNKGLIDVEENGPPSDMFVALCGEIADAQTGMDLTDVMRKHRAAWESKTISPGENDELKARGKERRKELTNP